MWTVVHEVIDKIQEPETDLWVDPSVLDWPGSIAHSTIHEAAPAIRAYEVHGHAERRLSEATTALDRVDVVTTLKRSVDHRLRLLDEIYGLNAIPVEGKPRRTLDILAYFGVARPLMVRELWSVRNAVEHEDADPPGVNELHRFVDLVWYFLRSTDRLVVRSAGGLLFEPDSEEDEHSRSCAVELDIEPRRWTLAMTARLRADQVSTRARSDWIVTQGIVRSVKTELVQVLGIVAAGKPVTERVVRLVLGGSFE